MMICYEDDEEGEEEGDGDGGGGGGEEVDCAEKKIRTPLWMWGIIEPYRTI